MKSKPNKSKGIIEIPTYTIEQIRERNTDADEVIFTSEKLPSLQSKLNKPYRSNYYGIGLCVSGKATLKTNLNTHTVNPTAIITISPQIIKQWTHVSEDFKTLTIFFTKAIFAKIFSNTNYIEQYNFFQQSAKHVNYLAHQDLILVKKLFLKIQEQAQKQHKYRKEIIVNYLNILFMHYQVLYENQNIIQKSKPSRNQQLLLLFKELVSKYFKQERTVSFYSDKLSITSKHLTEIVKKETGETASNLIDEWLIVESKILLSDASNTVSQISDMLNFPDASTFGKFFKKHTALTPLQYRNSL